MKNSKNEIITGCENCDLNCGVNVMGKMCGQERPDCNHWTAEKIEEYIIIPVYDDDGEIIDYHVI
jgi:hypothetical protein